MNYLVVLTTLPTRAEGRRLAERVLKKKLAACVNILGPAQSLFWWKGKVDSAKECLLFIKTRQSHFNRLRTFLEKHHPYSVPEIIALPVKKGNASYLKWIARSMGGRLN